MQSDFTTKGYMTQALHCFLSITVDPQVRSYLKIQSCVMPSTEAKWFLSVSLDSITTRLPFRCDQQEAEAASRFQTHTQETAKGLADAEAASPCYALGLIFPGLRTFTYKVHITANAQAISPLWGNKHSYSYSKSHPSPHRKPPAQLPNHLQSYASQIF